MILAKQVYYTDEYIPLPSQHYIHEIFVMKKFAYLTGNEKLINATNGKKAYRKFKNLLLAFNLRNQYYSFFRKHLIKIAKEWCKENEIEYVDDSEE